MENTTDIDIVDHLQWLANSAKPMDAAAMRLAADEIERLRLTDAEREAVEFFSAMVWPKASLQCKARSATLRGLLGRTRATGSE